MMETKKRRVPATLASAGRSAIIVGLIAIALYAVASPFLRKPDRPMFSDKFNWNDNFIPRWTEPHLFEDQAGNYCSIDTQRNSILVCTPHPNSPTARLVSVGEVYGAPYFTVNYQSNRPGELMLWSKSIKFANKPNTVYFLADDLAFELKQLRPGAAASLHKAILRSLSHGPKFADFAKFCNDHVTQ